MGKESHEPGTIGIIGGLGRMGRLFHRFFEEEGYTVRIADTRTDAGLPGEIPECDVLVLAVPIPSMNHVIRRIGPYTKEDGTVIDIASVKKEPVRTMLEHCRGEVIGCHPLFGPDTPSLEGRTVFVCPGRPGSRRSWFESFLKRRGAVVVHIEPEKHDRTMAVVQGLRQLLLFCFGRTLLQLDLDTVSDPAVGGPWFQTLIDLLAHQLEQPPDIYADIALQNTDVGSVFKRFSDNVEAMSASVESGDRDAVIGMMRELYEADSIKKE